MKHESPTVIGLDLGAFQTTAVASSGRQVTFRSCAGSVSGTEISEQDAVVGADWSELRSVVEPFSEGRFKFVNPGCTPAELEQARTAARALIRHAVSRVAPDVGGPVFGAVTLPARASDFNRAFLLSAVSGLLDACVLVPSPVAIAYGLGHLERTLVVDLGAGTVEIALVDGNLPASFDQITLPVGLSRTDRTFAELVQARHGLTITLDEARRVREKHGAAKGGVHGVVAEGKDGGEACASDCLTEACRALVASISTGLAELAQGGMQKPDTVIVTGGGSRLRRLPEVIADLIPEADLLVPEYGELCEADGAFRIAQDLPPDLWSQLPTVRDCSEPATRRAA